MSNSDIIAFQGPATNGIATYGPTFLAGQIQYESWENKTTATSHTDTAISASQSIVTWSTLYDI